MLVLLGRDRGWKKEHTLGKPANGEVFRSPSRNRLAMTNCFFSSFTSLEIYFHSSAIWLADATVSTMTAAYTSQTELSGVDRSPDTKNERTDLKSTEGILIKFL